VRAGELGSRGLQLQLDLFKLPKQPINKAVELATIPGAEQKGGAGAGAGAAARRSGRRVSELSLGHPQCLTQKEEKKTQHNILQSHTTSGGAPASLPHHQNHQTIGLSPLRGIGFPG